MKQVLLFFAIGTLWPVVNLRALSAADGVHPLAAVKECVPTPILTSPNSGVLAQNQGNDQVTTCSLQQITLLPVVSPESISSPPVAPQELPNAQPQQLKLDDLQAMAMANNPTLAQASANIQALQGKWWQDGRYPNPRLNYKGDEIGDDGRSGFQGVTATQEIVTSHKLQIAQNVTSQQVQQAQADYTAQEMRVRNDVKLRFYEVLLAEQALKLNQALETNSQAAVQAADDLFQAAQVGRGDVLQAKVEAELVQLQSVKARNAYQSAWRRLAVVVGLPELQPQPLAGDLRNEVPNMTWADAWNRVYSSSPELAAAQAKVAAAGWAVKKACADRCPNWEIEAGYAHDNATSFDTAAITVSVPVPLFNRNQGAIRQAQAELSAAQSEVDRVALDLRNRLALAFERFNNAKAVVDRYEQSILPNTTETLELNSSRYRAGEINFTALLVAQRTSLQTQVTYLESVRELRESSILLDGLLLVDSLAPPGR